jgi:hypothetical protein
MTADTPNVEGFLEKNKLLRVALDAMPIPVFVIDREFALRDCNAAGVAFLGPASGRSLRLLSGDALHCVNALAAPGGCGTSPACPECSLRTSVRESIARGEPVRRRWTLERSDERGKRKQFLFVTAADLPEADEPLSLVTLEDFTEFAELRGLVPICAKCKKIRNDSDYWEQLENYLSRHLDMSFTHGLCPGCLEEYFSEDLPNRPRPSRGSPAAPPGQQAG